MAKYTKHRMLGRKSSHRIALLRNLVTSLIEHESIRTTYPKAKAAQRVAEKVITWGKKGTNAAKNEAEKFFYQPQLSMPKLFGPLAERYRDRPGGYTRVLRIEPYKTDQAPSAILELVDGTKDMRFAMTAKIVANTLAHDKELNELTRHNRKKVIKFRPNGKQEFQTLVGKFRNAFRPDATPSKVQAVDTLVD